MRKRLRSHAAGGTIAVEGGGGSVSGNIKWGPDFGHQPANVSVSTALTELEASYNIDSRVSTALEAVEINDLPIGMATVAINRGTTSHLYNFGAKTVTQEAQTGAGWQNIANAAGNENTTTATFAGSLTAANAGTLVFSYRTFPDEVTRGTSLTSLDLDFWRVVQAGTVLANGTLQLLYRLNSSSSWVVLRTYTENTSSSGATTFSLLGLGLTWSDLGTLQAGVRFNTAATNTSTGSIDAVHLYAGGSY